MHEIASEISVIAFETSYSTIFLLELTSYLDSDEQHLQAAREQNKV